MSREKQLTITLLTEKLQKLTNKKVILEDAKDDQRVQDIKTKSGGSGYKAGELARQMASKITSPEKAYNRYLAANQIFGDNSNTSNEFLSRAVELKHPLASQAKKEKDDANRERWRKESEAALAKVKVKADEFLKYFKRRYPDFETSITTSSPVQYQSGDGKTLYVLIGGDIDKLTKGLAGLGDQRSVSRIHQGISTLANKFGGHYNFNYSKPYVSFRE